MTPAVMKEQAEQVEKEKPQEKGPEPLAASPAEAEKGKPLLSSEEKVEIARTVMESKLTRQVTTSLAACVHCGLCTEACHYYRAIQKPEMAPAYKADRLRNIYKRKHDWLGRIVPKWVGGEELNEEWLNKMYDSAYGSCTMCRRCTMNCPMGVDYGALMRAARSMMVAIGMIPPGLQATVDVHVRTGNNMGISAEDLVETLQWMEEEVQQELDDPSVRVPIDKKGAQVFYTMNPREPRFYPLTIQAMAKIFHVAGVDYTISTIGWDATNYALFSGDDDAARKIIRMQIERVEELGCQTLVAAECGHGYRAIRWEAENWLGRQAKFRIVSAVEFMAGLIKDGRLRFNRDAIKERVTYHDPCNQCRSGGIVNEPRYILNHVLKNFVEMEPHGVENYCCGGGGGALTMTEFAARRLDAGRVKVEQIKASGASIVATSCHNCLDQLAELSHHYKLGIKPVNLCELMADSLIVEK